MDKEHFCIHEGDFGILFTKIDMVTDALKAQAITNEALKIAVDASVKYITSMEAINGNTKAKKEFALQHSIFYSSIILAIAAIITSLIIEFAR